MIAAGHDLGQKDGNLNLRATLLSKDLVRNAKVEITAEGFKTPEMARLSNIKKYLDLDKSTYNHTAIN